MIRVFQMTDSLHCGGTETQFTEVARRLNHDPRYRITVGCLRAEGPNLKALRDEGISVLEFSPGKGLFTLTAMGQVLRLARFLRSENFHVVQTNDLYSNLLGVPAAWLARIPLIISSRRDLSHWWWYSPRNRQILRTIQSLSNLVVVNSYAVRNYLVDQDGFDPRRIRVIHNGVDLERFSNGDRKDVTLNRARSVIMVANMNVESKGHADLIDAARIVCHKLPETQFLLVGDGALRKSLEEQCRKYNLTDTVKFLGHRDDVPHLLQECDLAVLSSWSEGLPNAVLEAMAAGLPVVAARSGGTVELIRHNVTGMLVPPREPAELANAIFQILENPTLAEDLGRNGRDRAEAYFSYCTLLSKLDTLYQEGISRLN